MESRTVYAVWTNTDRTEGRGTEYVIYHCELLTTARRLAKKGYVQGGDCPITEEKLIYMDRMWYAPGPKVEPGNREDVAEEARLMAERHRRELKVAAIARAKELGMTDEEIAAISG